MSWPTSGHGIQAALDAPGMPHPDPSPLVGADSPTLFEEET